MYLADGCSCWLSSFLLSSAPPQQRCCWQVATQHLSPVLDWNNFRAIPMNKKHLYLRKNKVIAEGRAWIFPLLPFLWGQNYSELFCVSVQCLCFPFLSHQLVVPCLQDLARSTCNEEATTTGQRKGQEYTDIFISIWSIFSALSQPCSTANVSGPFSCINSSSFSFGASTWGNHLGLGEGL